MNPAVDTFQWLQLGDQSLADQANGEVNSVAQQKVRLHTSMRKVAYEQWRQRYPEEEFTKFNLRYAGAVLKLLTAQGALDEPAQLQLMEEFGVSSQVARERIQHRRRGSPHGRAREGM